MRGPVRRVLLAACGALIALPAAAVARTGVRPASRTVMIAAFAFAPARVTASVGDTVVWRNDDIVPHTASAADSSWDSGVLSPGGSWHMVMRARGRWSYRCTLHPSMTGTLLVR